MNRELYSSDILICGFFFFHSSSSHSSSDAFYLSVPENYHYLNQSGCIADKTISDKDSFKEVIVSCFTNSLCFKNIRGVDAWGLLIEQETKPSYTYVCFPLTFWLCLELSHRGTKLTGTYFS